VTNAGTMQSSIRCSTALKGNAPPIIESPGSTRNRRLGFGAKLTRSRPGPCSSPR
jgi:hypothetical protein